MTVYLPPARLSRRLRTGRARRRAWPTSLFRARPNARIIVHASTAAFEVNGVPYIVRLVVGGEPLVKPLRSSENPLGDSSGLVCRKVRLMAIILGKALVPLVSLASVNRQGLEGSIRCCCI
jgi:hypothetical protein